MTLQEAQTGSCALDVQVVPDEPSDQESCKFFESENVEFTSARRGKRIKYTVLGLFGLTGFLIGILLFRQPLQCQGDEQLLGNRCVPAVQLELPDVELPDIEKDQGILSLANLYRAYAKTFPKKREQQLPQIFPKKSRNKGQLFKQLFQKDGFVRLEDRRRHREAYQKVHNMVEKLRRGQSVKIVGIGGSPTARGEFIHRLGDFFRALDFKGQVHTYNMGHGAQGGNHAALLLDEFLPHDTDLVVWEFSINDAWGAGQTYETLPLQSKQTLSYLAKRNLLHMLGNSPSRPAVIMVYLWPKWNVPDHYVLDHGAFPFLLGSVDVKALRESFPEEIDRLGFMAHDHMHPSSDGNLLIAELLKRVASCALLTTPGEPEEQASKLALNPLEVTCIPESEAYQERFQTFIDYIATETSFPRSWSVIEPILGTSFLASPNVNPTLVTKVSSKRQDRRYVVQVPFCNSEERMQFTMNPSRDLTRHRPSRYLTISSERLVFRFPFTREPIANRAYELLEFTLSGSSSGETKVLKSPSESWDRWELDGKPVPTVHGPDQMYACGLQIGRAFDLESLGFHVSSVAVCARGNMTLQWLSVLD